jgi:uncharacterized membrane protein YbhN (UPF0104 family)
MFRALDRIPYTEGLARARRIPRLSRARLVAAAQWLVTAVALWLVVRSIDIGTVLDLIGRAALPGLGLAGIVVAAQFVVLAWRWQLALRIMGGGAVGLGLLSVFLGRGFVIGQVLPSSVGLDVARTVMLARVTGAATATRSVVCDRVLGFSALALLVAATLPMIAAKMDGPTPFLMLTVAALGVLAALAVALAPPLNIRTVPWAGKYLRVIAGDLRLALCSKKVSLVAVTVSVGSNLLGVLLIFILGSAIGADLRALDCLVLVPAALLVSSLPISLGGWGVREGALVAAFSLVHADAAGVAATSVMFGLTAPLAGAAVAAASLFAGWRNVLPKGSDDGG